MSGIIHCNVYDHLPGKKIPLLYILGIRIHSVCLMHISMTFEPAGYTCALVSRRGTCFWDGRHVQQSVRRMAKRMLKEFQEVSEVLNTSPNTRIRLFLEMTILCFSSHCSLVLIDLTVDFTG